MLNSNHMAYLRSYGVLIARILMGAMFLLSGVSKLMDAEGTAGYIGNAGLPDATALAVVVGIFEVVLGAAVIVGKRIAEAALLLAAFTLFVSFPFHGPSLWADNPMQQVIFMKNMAIIAGLLYIAAFGAGNGWKLDKEL